MERPKRWDVPFAEEMAESDRACSMDEASVARLMAQAPFSNMDAERFPPQLPLTGILRNDARLRRFEQGDVIVRQGDYGNSAFLILSGRVRVVHDGLAPEDIGRSSTRVRSAWRSFTRLLRQPASPESRDPGRYPQFEARGRQQTRATVVSSVANVPADKLLAARSTVLEHRDDGAGEWELFGELAALGRIPRALTVVAGSPCELLEIRWQGLRDLRKYDDGLRHWVDRRYRERGLDATLRSSPLLAPLSEDEIRRLSEVAQFETYGSFDWYGSYKKLRESGQGGNLADEPVIAEEGHYPNGLVLIRAGFARLSRRHGNGERTLRYLGRGDVYGLGELMQGVDRADGADALAHSLRAVGYVDVVRIPAPDVERFILPHLSPDQVREFTYDDEQDDEIDPAIVEFLGEHRYFNGTSTMMIDLDRCVRCDDCVRACASGHDNNPRFVRHGATLGKLMVTNACMHCMDPVCMIGCPTGAIHRDLERGEVVINDVTCVGCGTCANSCPYDNIRMVQLRDSTRDDALMMDSERGAPIVKATKCDLCIDHHGGPACERACPHDALVRIDMRDTARLSAWLKR